MLRTIPSIRTSAFCVPKNRCEDLRPLCAQRSANLLQQAGTPPMILPIRLLITNQLTNTDSFGTNWPALDSLSEHFLAMRINWPLLGSFPATRDPSQGYNCTVSMRQCLKFEKRRPHTVTVALRADRWADSLASRLDKRGNRRYRDEGAIWIVRPYHG